MSWKEIIDSRVFSTLLPIHKRQILKISNMKHFLDYIKEYISILAGFSRNTGLYCGKAGDLPATHTAEVR